MKPSFSAETASMSVAEREAQWKIVVAQVSEDLQVDIDGQAELIKAQR